MGWQDKVRDKFRDENEFPMSHIFVVHPESYWPLIMEVAEEQAGDEMRGNLRNYILDYTLERPLQVVLDTTPELDDSDGFREHCEVVDNFLSDFLKGNNLEDVFKSIEGENISPRIFVKNPHHMTVFQVNQLERSLMMGLTNRAALPRTMLYLPGGDWWHRPENHYEIMPFDWLDLKEGDRAGSLEYERAEDFMPAGKFLDWRKLPFQEYRDAFKGTNGLSVNVHGLFGSGKTFFADKVKKELYRDHRDYGLVTVHPEFSDSELFEADFSPRQIKPETVLMLDRGDRLQPELLARLRSDYPKHLVTSEERMDGFDRYIDTVEFQK